ncbi:hypothetical protein CAEBREN_29866 [Caenorhabditis brenneri]|uniref:Uncharacterized protein n=1 Tax=Caenorhabditis brenneri TaxID=135651 RepID=G0PM14_CAEBE|nr:hypothetical protein CAEBREN_29866 [Caenorhabditis brenneri]
MSTYSELCRMYGSDVDEEELQTRELFEKPRGERRWLGRRNHKGKERLHNAVKDSNYIEKTVTSTEPLSKNATRKIKESTKDELELNVSYSLDKKNRWMGADTVALLGGTPENLNAEIVEKNVVDKSIFAVHSKRVNFEQAPGEFDVRSATSSGKGQHYSNFLPKSRELGKKANAKLMKTHREDGISDAEAEPKPTISYNIYKAHPNQEVVGSKLFISKITSKSGRHKVTKKFDMEEYGYEDELDDEEDDGDYEPQNAPENTLDLSDLYVDTYNKQKKKKKNNRGSPEVLNALAPEPDYTNLLNIQDYLRQEGLTFEKFDITFHNQEDNFERQIDELRLEKKLIIKDLRPQQYLIDVSEWCQLDGEVKDGETTAVIVITQLKKNKYNFLINSTIAIDPSKRGCGALIKRICHATTLRHAISHITSEILTARKIVETMRISTQFYGRKTFPELLRDPDEWENQMVNMSWPNQYYHATWANSEELSQVGGKFEWKDLCAMAKSDSKLKTGYTSNDRCGSCNQGKRSHELYFINNESKLKCTECLKDEFYREVRARRVPIDLETDTADELEYLPTFVPLTIINLYIRVS